MTPTTIALIETLRASVVAGLPVSASSRNGWIEIVVTAPRVGATIVRSIDADTSATVDVSAVIASMTAELAKRSGATRRAIRRERSVT